MDGAVDDRDGATSGTRLKLVWNQFSNGVRNFKHIFDTALREDCTIGLWEDAALYCTPNNIATVAYADSQCTQKVVRSIAPSDCTETPRYAVEYISTTCRTTSSRLFTVGEPLAPRSMVWVMSHDTCTGYPADGEAYFALGAELSTDVMARIDLESPEGDGRLLSRSYVSADGLRLPLLGYDADLQVDCWPVRDWGPTGARCTPHIAPLVVTYADASCTQDIAYATKTCPRSHDLAVKPASCAGERNEVFVMTDPASTSSLYRTSGGICSATTPHPANDYYHVEPVSLIELDRSSEGHPNDRLKRIYSTTPDGARLRDWTMLFDAELDVECYPAEQPDGTVRCLPSSSSTYISKLFTDTACTEPIALAWSPSASCTQEPVPRFAFQYEIHGLCPATHTFHQPTTEFFGEVYERNGSECRLHDPRGRLFRIGPAIPPTEFAKGTIVTDP